MYLKKCDGVTWNDFVSLSIQHVADCRVQGNETAGFVESCEFLGYPLNIDSAQWSYHSVWTVISPSKIGDFFFFAELVV